MRTYGCIVCAWLLAAAVRAEFAIPWFTPDGGGASAGGIHAVHGAIGQPDAGRAISNATHAVTGGFWALPVALQTPGAPALAIAPAEPGFVTLSWPPGATGFVLQESYSLMQPRWMGAPSGATNPAVVPVTVPVKFYRLLKIAEDEPLP